jgi:wyosine [tRNA(Phe)-imidazoG37] synthetase (radical SAM superfamily)
MSNCRHLYGPVCSRRLGRSLGIDLVPYKVCTYNCVYCQLGRTTDLCLERREYVPIPEVVAELETKLAAGADPDYITLAGSGEPTLNSGLDRLIKEIHRITGIPVAVLTNGSLLWRPEVRRELMAADLVIPSLDAGDEALFHYVNRPHPDLDFETVVNGLATFRREFSGALWLEVVLLAGVTGILSEVQKIAALVERIQPARVQLNTVTRPPAEDYAFAMPAEKLERFAGQFPVACEVVRETAQKPLAVSPLPEEGEEGLLTLLSRRPAPLNEIAEELGTSPNEILKRLKRMLQQGLIAVVSQNGRLFYKTVRSS